MRAIRISFLQMLAQMRKDFMLFIMPFVPFLAGAVFRFAIPFAEQQITRYFAVAGIITPYYQLIDALLILLTPTLISFVAALIMLEESDDGIISYLSVTPLGKSGYLVSRLGIATVLTIPLNMLVFALFHIEGFGILNTLLLSIVGAVQGCVVALMIVALSSNKVEGMAIGKMTSLLTIGLVVPYFISGPAQYIFAITPSYWIGRFIMEGRLLYLGVSLLIDVVWVLALAKRFMKKIQ